jgi:hypothetical protein
MAAVFMAGAVQLFTADSAIAQENPTCDFESDFVTGGGFIFVDTNNDGSFSNANFGVAGACGNGSFWGHLNYVDHTTEPPIQVHWITITAYRNPDSPDDFHTRDICGTAETKNPSLLVDFHVRVTDNDQPETNSDTFIMRLFVNGSPIYTTENDPDHTLHGGNIQLHEGDPPPKDDGTCPDDFVPPE